EIAAILISFDKHSEWQSKEVKTRTLESKRKIPKSGSMLLYSRKKVRYRRDGYCWKKRKDGKTTREDHMKLKVQGTECIYGCYVHSAILPTFHRRCYWLLQNPDIVLVHYLNVPYPDDNKMAVITPNLALWGDKKEWTKEELVSQLKPMFFSEDEPDTANEIEISTAETVEAIVSQLMEKQRMARQTALVKQLECGCPDANCADGKSCSHPMRRISAAKSVQELGKRADGHGGGSGGGGTAPNVLIGSRMYPRWLDNRRMATGRVEQQQQQQQSQHQQHTILDPNGARAITPKTLDTSIHFQVIPTSAQSLTGQNSIRPSNQNTSGLGTLSGSNSSSQLTSVSSHITNGIIGSQANHLGGHRSAMIITSNQHQQQQQQHHQQHQHHQQQHQHHQHPQQHPNVHGHPHTQQQQHTLTMNGNNNSSSNSSSNSSGNNSTSNNNTSNTNGVGSNQLTAIGHSNQVTVSNGGGTDRSNATNGVPAGSRDANINLNGSNENHISMIGSTGQSVNRPSNALSQRSDGSCGDSSGTSGGGTMSNAHSNGQGQGGQGSGTVHHNRLSVNGNGATSTPPLVLSLGQNLGAPGSLLILNGQQQSYVCQQSHQQKVSDKDIDGSIKTESSSSSVPKQEMMDASSSPVPSLSHHQQRQSSQQSNSSPSSATTTGGSSDKQSFDSIFGYQDHTPMASPVRTMDNSGGSGGGGGPTHHHDNLPFFNETLDLSQEDIQKTLSANMPLGGHVAGHETTPTDDAMNGEINPMDFIENCGDNHGTVDDDVFVNLDAFDMLVEFPELELDAKSEFLRDGAHDGTNDAPGGGEHAGDSGSELGQYKHHVQNQPQQQQSTQTMPNVSTISDFSPEWAYPEGGIKVLVTGPWNTSSAYTVLFDSFPVPTTLVQDGVLRCYCPAHEVGIVTLQVACDGFVISNAVNFEYKSPPKFETKCEGNGNDMLYKFNLLNRLESIDEKLQIKIEPGELPEDTLLFKQNNFEDRLVNYCETLTAKMWRSVTPGPFIDKHQGMTLLHLAAALGYAKLVRTMLTWKAENSNVILEAEIDALSQDKDGYTPLTLACARGHIETAIILYKWNQNALNVRNNAQKGPVEVARDYGHRDLAHELERQEKERIHIQQRTPTSASIPTLASISSSTTASSSTISASSASPNTLPTSCSNHSSSASSPSTSPAQTSTGQAETPPSSADNRFPGNDLLSNLNESNSSSSNSSNSSSSTGDCKATDGNNNLPSGSLASDVHSLANDTSGSLHNFLNLNQIFSYGEGLHGTNSDSCSNDNFGLVAPFNPSLSPTALSPYSEMKGSCSSTGSQSGGLHYGLENTNSNPMLSNALSPNSDSNRSHDGVFLRPGAVYSSQSPPGARLSKRSSIDSGINMENRSVALSRTGKAFREAQRTNRMDRSMSLPLASASGVGGGLPSGKNQPGTPSSTAAGDRETDSFSLSLSESTSESPSQLSSNVSLLSPLRKMDFALCEVSATETSPMCEDADSLQEDDCHLPHHQLPDSMDMGPGASGNGAGAGTNTVGQFHHWDSDAKVLTLAEQIIAAMPERIKNESEETMYLGSPLPDSLNEDTTGMGILNDTFMEPLLDSLPSSQFDQEFNFEFSDHSYRYHDVGTPCSSLSPASSGPLQSPASYSIPQDHPVGSPSPPPTTQDFTEFLQSSNATVRPFEADFSNLKLNDREQRELYEAAKCIQKAYRSYKGRKSRMEEQDKERTAAVVIQNYYRRYKQYAYYRQMTQAALVIQNGYRSYCENKRFKKSQTTQQLQQPVTSSEEDKASAQCLETYYQNFRNEQKQQQSPQQQQQNNQPGGSGSKEPSPSGPLKLQKERAEKERLVHLRRVEYLQSLQCHEQPEAPQPTNAPK
uniref:CG-1 domain-containing protein n=1 Tax=Anopheles christyi TaxID=43041 RepID=A0A182JNF8_9DIPT